MDTAVFPEDVVVKKVSIVGSELVENYTVYVIEVTVRDHRWTIKHRYSDFHDLHEKLTAEKKIEKHLLPPKKMIGKNSKSLVEKRQKELEVYLQTLLVRFPTAAPKVLSYFLHFHQYEMNGITAALAEELFHKGEQLLVAGEVFTLCPLQLYAITQQLKLAKPTCSNGDAKADLGHILDFTCRLKYLKITGTRGEVGTSNIQEDSLTFDLSVFKALLQIEISECNSAQIMGLPSLKPCLVTLSVHHTAASMMDVLVPEACESPQWVAEGALSDCPVTTIIPTWKTLTTLDMSHNHIGCIDNSVKLIPKVEFLDLSSNELSTVENLQHLYNLIHLDLSYNILTVLEGAHTKLGNIKTLNLAGNQLDSLAGLTKLYSLVNLDLSSNKLGQLEEIRYIGTLPCLEKLMLSNNPMCIIPDYRTKVLAQFWDRASEVCLDSTAPTEKELDTVEVLKAIQKAKESKDRMANNNEKKISEDSRLSGGGSSISSSVAAASSSSSSLLSSALAPACSSQEVICKEEAFVTPTILTPVDFIALDTQRCYDDVNTLPCEEQLQVTSHQPDDDSSSFERSSTQQNQIHGNSSCCCCCVEDREERYTWSSTNLRTPVLPLHLPSSTSSCPSFTSLLSARITRALAEEDGRPSRLRDLPSQEETDLGSPSPSPSPSSGDGYFEMGLGEGKEREGEEGSLTDQVEGENQAPETEVLRVIKVMWCHCIRVDDVVEQRSVCVVLTNSLLGLFHCPSHPATAPTHQPQSQPHDLGSVTVQTQCLTLQTLVDNLEPDFVLPYDQLDSLLFYIPDTCLSLRVRSSDVRWYLFSDPQGLKETHSLLCSLAQLPSSLSGGPSTPQQLLHLLFTSWEFEENQGCVKGGYAAHLVETAMLASQTSQQTTTSTNPTLTPMKTSTNPNTFNLQTLTNPLLSDILSHVVPGRDRDFSCCVPCVLFLTQRHLCVLKVDFKALARGTTRDEQPPDNHNQRLRSCSRLTRIPLASVLRHPRPSALYGAGSRSGSIPAYSPSCPLPWHHRSPRDSRVMELLVGQERVTAVFPLPHDRLRFQRQFTLLRSSLRDIKTVAFLQGGNEHSHSDGDSSRTINIYTSTPNETKSTDRLQVNSPRGAQRPRPSLSLSYPTDILVEKLTGDNQVPSHLSLSPALSLVSGLRGHQLLGFFHTNIAEEEKEELHHILWSSVVFYKSPDVEATSCIMLSTKALYFLLDDSASTLNDQSLLWDRSHCDHQDPELIMSYCLTIDLHDLHSVNVGLFDQYFRVVGPSANHIICCLTRDSYGTHRFLQQLMTVLSLQDKLPSPEPSEQDFYSQFGNKSTGKMENYELVHSSRVKFIYPSEEEIGDLTFIVAERKGPSGASSCNILLYVLVFQVQTQGLGFSQGLNVLPQTQAPAADRQTSTGGLQGDRKSHLHPQSPVSASQPRLHPYPQAPGPAPSIRPHIPQQSLPPQAPSTPRPVLHPKTLILTSTDVFLLDEDYISYPLPDFAKEPPPRDKYQLTDARRIRDLDRVLMGYQTYPQALTLVFDDVPGPDLLCQLTMDHFGEEERGGGGGGEKGRRRRCGGTENEVLWCIYVPGADSRERLICLLARQWEVLCSRELPVELTG
ncbi:nischarin isoform X1 [Salvelinus alpinus]|uniref:nischarin isoform X1 n=2 Tax=Salvelinus alpinus TaxID=8036 RepID=UPI0039FBBD9F